VSSKGKKAAKETKNKPVVSETTDQKICLRFCTVELEAKITPSRVTTWLDRVFLRCLGPKTITNLLSKFRSKKNKIIKSQCL